MPDGLRYQKGSIVHSPESLDALDWDSILDPFVWVGCPEHCALLVPLLPDGQVTEVVLGIFAVLHST